MFVGTATQADLIKPVFTDQQGIAIKVQSLQPHKHEINNPPREFDLDELYYFQMDHPDGFALVRTYNSAGTQDVTVTIHDGDLALLRDGYHLVAVPPGCNVYYQAVLAGAARSLASSVDPRYATLRDASPDPDPRVPMIDSV